MKKSILLTLNFLLVISPIFGDEDIRCTDIQGALTVCEKDNEWIYVNQTADKDEVIFNITGPLSIAPNAFQNLRVKYLFLIMEDDVLTIQPKSFEGLEKVTVFYIYHATVSLEEKTFEAMSSLRSLDFVHCNFTDWNSEQFAGLQELEELAITESNIYTINHDTFRGVESKLFDLNLNVNRISEIESDSFLKFSNLKKLQLFHNELHDIKPRTFDGLKNLRELWLNENHLKIIRKNDYDNLKKLKNLQLTGNGISIIEAGAFDGLSLKYLGLGCNKLTVLSAAIFNGASIDSMGIFQNQTLHIERNAFRNLGLQEIYLSFDYNSTVESWGVSESAKILSRTCMKNEVRNGYA